MSGYPEVGDVWIEKSTGRRTLIVGKGRERPWPITWLQVLLSSKTTYWGVEFGTKRSMRDWFDAFERSSDQEYTTELSQLQIIEIYEADGEDCSDLRAKFGLPDK